MTFIDFFAGIGGFTAGLSQAGMECVGFCENDKWAIKSYTAIHSPQGSGFPATAQEQARSAVAPKLKRKEWFCNDITESRADEIPYADGWTAGFPCQDISVCGKQTGLNGERGRLFFEIIRLLKGKSPENRPKWLLFENVRNLVSVNGGRDFTTFLNQISEVGYDCEWQIVNSRMFVPQNRERIFIVGHFRNGSPRKVFPISGASSETTSGELIEIIGGMQGKRVYCSQGLSVCLTAQAGGFAGKTGAYCVGSCPCFIDLTTNPKTTDIARCIKARYDSGISNRTAENSGVLTSVRIRKLTPRECFRLQGFSDEQFERAAAVNSDNQLYKQAGNSVTVPVIRAIGERLVQAYES
jgi:DNA (cytosine-5)-methyltransferase 1